MIKEILGGGVLEFSDPAGCDCKCDGKCTSDPGYAEGYKDGHTEQKTAVML